MKGRGSHDPAIVIVGAGFSGLGMAIKLKQAGIDDFVVLEKANEVGGTWRENTYPGCACDIASLLYSYSFEPRAGWSHMFPRQAEILDYLEHCADVYGIRSHIRFGTEVTGTEFDDATDRWHVVTATGETIRARAFIAAVGPLHRPNIPDIPGLARFAGTMFHSAEWNHAVDLAGKRIAVIGTGASAVQFVPRIARQTAQLHVFQRTPPWVLPRPDRRLSTVEHRLFRGMPALQRALRYLIYWYQESLGLGFAHPRLMGGVEAIARWHIRRQIAEEELRRKVTPDYTIGCKRILLSNDYYPALTRPNTELVTEEIVEVREHSIVTRDGVERAVDAIVLGTGFHATDAFENAHIVGRNGVKITDAWRDGMEAYLGVTLAGFPNLFFLLGPNSGLAHNSMVFMIEAQVRHVVQCLRLMEDGGARRVEVRPSAQAAFNRNLQDSLTGTVWSVGGCDSWYLDRHGVNRTLWPGSTVRYWLRTRRLRTTDYEVTPAAGPARRQVHQDVRHG
ncbi:MAG: flavin-containing monooxygenase [Egibacteraceae bacterium]